MTPNTYEYSASYRQPDPEIWSGGVAGGPLVFSSNIQESFSRIYNNSISVPNSATGVIIVYGASLVDAEWTGTALHFITGYSSERISHSYIGNFTNISLSGSATEKFISSDDLLFGSLVADIFSTEKTTYDYNLDSSVSFSTENNGLISESIIEINNYGNILDAVTQGQEDYGSTQIFSQTSSAIGSINLGGLGLYDVLNNEINTVLLAFSNELIEKVSFNFNSDPTSSGIGISGSSSNVFISYNPPETPINLISSGELIEKTTNSYNDSSIIIFGSENNGLISDLVDQTISYGFITNSPDQGNEDSGLIIFDSLVIPFGTVSFGGSAFVKAPDDIRTYGTGANYKVSYNPPENICPLFHIGGSTETVVYNYNQNSIVSFEIEDTGSVVNSVDEINDYGFLGDIVTEFIEYGSVEFVGEQTPFGSLIISGAADTQFTNVNFYNDEVNAEVKIVYSPDNTEGTLFTFGERVEKVTYDYNLDSIKQFIIENFESISSAATTVTDYGSIVDIPVIFEDQGLVDDPSFEQTPFGSLIISGAADTQYTNINFYGDEVSAEVKIVYSPDNTEGTLFEFGETIERVAYDYNLDSVFFVDDPNYGSIIDSITIFQDYQSIFNIHSQTEDFGSILGFSAGNDVFPFGSLIVSGSSFEKHVENYYVNDVAPETKITISSGYSNLQFISQDSENILLFSFYGSALEGNVESYVGSGSLFKSDSLIEKVTYNYNIDSDVNYIIDPFGLISDPTIESLDYGQLISWPSQGYEDLGTVIFSDVANAFGSILLSGQSENLYESKIVGSIVNINITGAKEERASYVPIANENSTQITLSGSNEYAPVIYSEIGSGSLFSVGTSDKSVTYDYNESSILEYEIEDSGFITNPFTSTIDHGFVSQVYLGEDDGGFVSDQLEQIPFGSININGSANTEWINVNFYGDEISAQVKVVYSPDNTQGTLFGFGEKLESFTYDYNETSFVIVEQIDSGLIVDSISTIEDYGFINEVYVGVDNNGQIDSITSIPFGLLSLTGSAETRFDNANFYSSPEAIVRVVYSPDNTEGTLFTFGEKLQSFTYDYNEDSIFFAGVTDSGFIDGAVSIIEDYGFTYEIHSQVEDYQSLIDFATSTDVYPFGSLIISGNALTSKILEVSFGGLFTIFGSSFTDYTPKYTGLGDINFSGSSIVRFSSAEFGTESIFVSGTKFESRTKSYNQSSILNPSDRLFDYGSLSETTEVPSDYGFIAESLTQNSEDLGFINEETSSTIYPFGTIVLSGTPLVHPEVDYTPKYTGGGFINISGSAVESETDAFGVGRRRGGNINLGGDATLSHIVVADETSGSIFIGGFINEKESDSFVGFGTIFVSDFGVESDVDSYIGFETLNIFGGASESYVANPLENDIIITISGSIVEKNTESYVGFENIQISGNLFESETDSYIGDGLIIISGSAEESDSEIYIGLGIASFSGNATESFTSNPPENIQLFTLSGELNHPQIDYTPHYGIEKNIGVGTTGIQISGVVDDSAQRAARGTGLISVVNGFSPQESYPWLPGAGVGRSWSYTRSTYIAQGTLNISSGVALTNYYSPIYPRNSGVPGSGIGTIRINDDNQITFYRATLPVNAKGTIYILGIGTAANGDLDGVEIGANESFTPTTEIGTGLFTISGIASAREIAVYTAVGFGTIILSGNITRRDTKSYLTSGTIHLGKYEVITQSLGDDSLTFDDDTVGFDDSSSEFIYSEAITTETDAYEGTGRISALSGASESLIIQSTSTTQLFTVSGSAQESFIAQTPENTVLYQFSGAASDEKLVKSYSSSGSIDFSGTANINFSAAHEGSGTFRFVKYTSDQIYDTCDSEQLTCDYQNSAYVSFIANSPENTILYNISGNAITTKTALYTKFASGIYTLSGTYQDIKLTHSESGIGTAYITESSSESEKDVYIGSGSLFTLFGSTEYYSAQTPEFTIILQISGSATTSVEFEYQIVGIGLFAFTGSAITSEIATYTQTGLGVISLSGELVHPNIRHIPSPDGFGTISILGSSNESITRIYDGISGSLFGFSSGLESFTKSTYTGVGTIYIQPISSLIINNPFQIPRTYVCII